MTDRLYPSQQNWQHGLLLCLLELQAPLTNPPVTKNTTSRKLPNSPTLWWTALWLQDTTPRSAVLSGESPRYTSPLPLRLLQQAKNSCQLGVAECGTVVQRRSRGHLPMSHLTHTCGRDGGEGEGGSVQNRGATQAGRETEGRTLTACGDTTPLEMHHVCTKPTPWRRQTTTKWSAHNLYFALFRLGRKQQLKCHQLFY